MANYNNPFRSTNHGFPIHTQLYGTSTRTTRSTSHGMGTVDEESPSHRLYMSSKKKDETKDEIVRILQVRSRGFGSDKEEVFVQWADKHKDSSWVPEEKVDAVILLSYREQLKKDQQPQVASSTFTQNRFNRRGNIAPYGGVYEAPVFTVEDHSPAAGVSKRTRSHMTQPDIREEKQLGARRQTKMDQTMSCLEKLKDERKQKQRKKQGRDSESSILISDDDEAMDPYTIRTSDEENSAKKPAVKQAAAFQKNRKEKGDLDTIARPSDSSQNRRSDEENVQKSDEAFFHESLSKFNKGASCEGILATLRGRPVDLYALYQTVAAAGGFNQCSDKWLDFCRHLDLGSDGAGLKKLYQLYLLEFSKHFSSAAAIPAPAVNGRKPLHPQTAKATVSDVLTLTGDDEESLEQNLKSLGTGVGRSLRPKRNPQKELKQSKLEFPTEDKEPSSSNSSNIFLNSRYPLRSASVIENDSDDGSIDGITEPVNLLDPVVCDDAPRGGSEEIPPPPPPPADPPVDLLHYVRIKDPATRPPGFEEKRHRVVKMWRVLEGMDQEKERFYCLRYDGEDGCRIQSTAQVIEWNPDFGTYLIEVEAGMVV